MQILAPGVSAESTIILSQQAVSIAVTNFLSGLALVLVPNTLAYRLSGGMLVAEGRLETPPLTPPVGITIVDSTGVLIGEVTMRQILVESLAGVVVLTTPFQFKIRQTGLVATANAEPFPVRRLPPTTARRVLLHEDFLAEAFPGNQNWVASGTGVVAANTNVGAWNETSVGSVAMQVGAPSQIAVLRQGQTSYSRASLRTMDFEARIWPISVNAAGQEYTFRAGFFSGLTAIPDRGIWLEYGPSFSGAFAPLNTPRINLVAQSSTGGVVRRVLDTGFTLPAGEWTKLRVGVVENEALAFINDRYLGALDISELALDVQESMGWGLGLAREAGTGTRTILCDYVTADLEVNR